MESAGNNLHTHLPQLSNFALLNLCSAHFLSRVFWLPGPKHRPPAALCLSASIYFPFHILINLFSREWLHQQIGKITKEVWCRMRMGYILRYVLICFFPCFILCTTCAGAARPIQLPIVTLRIECTRLLSRAGRQPSCRWSSLCEDATTRKAIHVLCRKLVSSCQGYSYSHRRPCLPTRSLPQRGMSSALDALDLKVPFAFDAVPQCDFVHSIRSL
jgi:hypothetical protein